MIILRQKEYSTLLGRTIAGINKNVLKRSKIKSYRTAVKGENKVLNTVLDGINSVKKVYYTPGDIINKGISKVIENPVSTIGVVLGKVTDVTNPETIILPKSTIAAVVGNKILPKKVRVELKNASDKYNKTKVHELIEKSPSIPELAYKLSELGRSSGIY